MKDQIQDKGGRKHQKFIQQCKSNTEEVNDKSPGPVHFGIASEKEVLQLSTEEREKISFPHESLKMVSLFLSSDQEKSKTETGVSHQPGAIFSQNKLLSNFPENSDDESAHSTFRKSLFKASHYTYKNTEFKDRSVEVKEIDTYLNTSENMKEVRKEDLWRNNHNSTVTKASDFTLRRVNDGDIAFKNAIKMESFSNASEILDITGTTGRKLENLRAVTEIPTQFRSIFKEFPYFNYAQSKALDDLLYTDRNFVICAPTGSGKTVMFELAITRLLMEAPLPWMNIKVVYMAPVKALCSQRFDDWKEKFGPLGLSCKELTGDTVMDDLFEIHHADIIITTPEKWDSMTRRWRDNSIVQLVRLFLIDEVHVIKDEGRGATLEVVVSRMKTVQSSLWRLLENHDTVPPLRFVAVSATIPNAEDIAEWLSDSKTPAVCLKIDEDQRPVKLRKIVLGFPCSDSQTEFKFDLTLNYKIANIIQTYSEQKPALVFCATRKGVQQAASVLAKDAKFLLSIEQKQRLQMSANSLKDAKLRDLLMYGVAYHHAGMEVSDRKIIEGAFTVGDLPVLWLSDFLASCKNNFSALLNSLILAKCFRCKLWENSLHVSKQLEKIGVSLSNAMVNAGLTTFQKIEDTNPRELELILNRHPPFGNQIKESVLHLPKYELDIEQLPKYSDTLAEILVTIKLTNYEQLQTKRTATDFHYVTLLIGNADNQVIFNQKIMDSVLLKTGNWMKKIEVKRARKSEDISINLISSDYGGRSKQETIYKKYGNRECNHRCKNKDACGHDCCKTGVPPKSEINGESKFSLYLADLRSRNSISSVPPVKRLKMQMLNQAPNVDLKQFGFTPKPSLPALPRSSNKQLSSSPSVDQVDNINSLGVSQKQLQSWNYGKTNALDVDFELREDVWDDIDDEKLVFASNFANRESDKCEPLCQYPSSKATNDISIDLCTLKDETNIQNSVLSVVNSTSKANLSVQSGNADMFSFQEKNHSNLSQELKTVQCSSISKIISDSSKFTRKEDFFIFTKEYEKEVDPRYLLDDEISDVKPFLGIFDGLL